MGKLELPVLRGSTVRSSGKPTLEGVGTWQCFCKPAADQLAGKKMTIKIIVQIIEADLEKVAPSLIQQCVPWVCSTE